MWIEIMIRINKDVLNQIYLQKTKFADTPTCRAEFNETYLECPTSQTDGTCADPAPREKRLRSCTPRCGCKEGEVRNNDGVCVEYARCFSFEGKLIEKTCLNKFFLCLKCMNISNQNYLNMSIIVA